MPADEMTEGEMLFDEDTHGDRGVVADEVQMLDEEEEDEEDEEDEELPGPGITRARSQEVKRYALALLRHAHEPATQTLLLELKERMHEDEDTAALADELCEQIDCELLGAVDGTIVLGAPWIDYHKLGPLASFIPPQVQVGIDLLNMAKSTIDAIAKPARAKIAAVKADAQAGDPHAQAAMTTLQQAAKIHEAAGQAPAQGGFRNGPNAHPAQQGRGGFSAYRRGLYWMNS